MKRRLLYLLPVAVWLAAIWWQSSRHGSPAPIPQSQWFAVTTLGHLVEYSVLGFLMGRLVPAGRGLLVWVGVWVLAVLWGISDEFHQSFVPGREVSLWDISVDTVSAGFGVLACWLLRRQWAPALLARLAG